LLVQLVMKGDLEAPNIGVELVRMWAHVDPNAMNQRLAQATMTLASQRLQATHGHDLYTWREVLKLLCTYYPKKVAELTMSHMTDANNPGGWSDENIEVLTRAAAIDPSSVMDVIGATVLDKERRPFFGISTYQGLFDAIGPHHIDSWIRQHGREHLRWLARHFSSPYLDAEGSPIVPPVTDWLLREYESDDEAFQWFLMGRNAGKVWTQREINSTRKRDAMKPFLKHGLRRVREWAAHEIQEEEKEEKFFREMDEEDERR
jgi:hypothetical protein